MADVTIRICNWDEFQHYKDRSPPWIKLHRALIDKREWFEADDTAARLLVECWLLASETEPGGEIRRSFADIAWRFRRDEAVVATALLSLERLGFIEIVKRDAFKPLAERVQAAPQRRGETETEKEAEGHKVDRVRSRQLPDDWKPNDSHRALADRLGVSVADELPQFKDHHRSKGSVMKDWDAAFRTWLRNAKRFQRNTPSADSAAGRVLSVRSDDVARQREKRARDADASADDVSRWIAAHKDEADRVRAACFDGVSDDDLAARALAMAAFQKRIRELMEAA